MKRTSPQNNLFHKWCGVIALHLRGQGVAVSQAMVKEIVLLKLGNTVEMMDCKIAMRSSDYKITEDELSQSDVSRDFVSMSGLLVLMEAWATTDLGLLLMREPV